MTKIEEGRRKAEKERKDIKRRVELSRSKPRYRLSVKGKKFEFLEPRTEQGVLWLLSQINAFWPDIFPWLDVLDLDQHFGYDLLVSKKNQLSEDKEHGFVEVKYELRDSEDFNHSFDFLSAVVCWNSRMTHDSELLDIQEHKRIFKVTPPDNQHNSTRCFLSNPAGGINVEVIVLKKYLEEVLGMKML